MSRMTEESEEPIPVHIRGYNDHERKAVYMEGSISPMPQRRWKVEDFNTRELRLNFDGSVNKM